MATVYFALLDDNRFFLDPLVGYRFNFAAVDGYRFIDMKQFIATMTNYT